MNNQDLRNAGSIELVKCANGVLVRTPYSNRTDSVSSPADSMVFDSRDAFIKWVGDFFPSANGEKFR